MNDVANKLTDAEVERHVESFHSRLGAIRTEVRKIIVGQDDVVDHLLMTLLVGGHCLITGMPGTAKTLLVRTLARAPRRTCKRIQFTPGSRPPAFTARGTGCGPTARAPTASRRTSRRAGARGRSCRARCSRTCCS